MLDIDEFPKRLHHPKESNLLFFRLAKRAPELLLVIDRLEQDQRKGEQQVRALQHLLLAWKWLGEERREAFAANRNPLTGHAPDPAYERLFQRILEVAPAPIGLDA